MTSPKLCAQCGKNPVSGRATYCSDKCRKAATRKPAATPEVKVVKGKKVGEVIDTSTGEVTNTLPSADPNYDYEAALKAFEAMGIDDVDWITTGIPEFDALTMIPRGRVTQIQGPYAVGKTTLCLNMIRGLGKHKVLYIDTEASLNPRLLADMRINPANFVLYNKSAFIEDVYDQILEAVAEPKYDMIILDSLAACTFATEAAGDAASANIGQKAKIVGKLMRVVPMELKRTNTALVIINQERELLNAYGQQKYTPGGMGVPYAASLMVSLKTTKGARFPQSGPPFQGHKVTAEIIKSKVNEPWRKAEFKLFYGLGGSR